MRIGIISSDNSQDNIDVNEEDQAINDLKIFSAKENTSFVTQRGKTGDRHINYEAVIGVTSKAKASRNMVQHRITENIKIKPL